MNLSYLVACGLLVTFLSDKMDAQPLTPAQQKSLRSLLGEELAEFLESGENENRLDDVRSRMRLLRDLRVDTRARGMWARLLNDQPASRRHKSGSKKGGSTSRSGCFGHKMDRIGTISGMGC
ncbi:C-type natriuretic peptide 4 precursor [Oryzias latipes]|uniref:C-type natriuretic peptide 4 n=1 Tax=Oryzias latipes TaxID=8090 RepID=ANFC4_ORYLA|nr:C-type natriuretic peptide 4 precursor [Oryzias latipes]Q800I7.1 RecName: Full=C-type natriuretic peptide 4; Flags: Precursor [Oryzias latipes]BAC65998.1 C-type natriuretic peptide-4 [Oryzias latipes]